MIANNKDLSLTALERIAARHAGLNLDGMPNRWQGQHQTISFSSAGERLVWQNKIAHELEFLLPSPNPTA